LVDSQSFAPVHFRYNETSPFGSNSTQNV